VCWRGRNMGRCVENGGGLDAVHARCGVLVAVRERESLAGGVDEPCDISTPLL
jgi:hypothetical protein